VGSRRRSTGCVGTRRGLLLLIANVKEGDSSASLHYYLFNAITQDRPVRSECNYTGPSRSFCRTVRFVLNAITQDRPVRSVPFVRYPVRA
jgi:hypothetical protein